MCPTSFDILQHIYYEKAIIQIKLLYLCIYKMGNKQNKRHPHNGYCMCSTEDGRGTHIYCNAILQADYCVELLCTVKQSGTAGVKSSSHTAAVKYNRQTLLQS